MEGIPRSPHEWGAGCWAVARSITGWTAEPQNCPAESTLSAAGGGHDAPGAPAQPWTGSPRRADTGAVITGFRLTSVQAWLLLGGWGCGVHDPGAPRRSQLTSGASKGSQDGGSASVWDPPAAQQVTSRVGRGPLGGQGQHVLPQGREKGPGKLTGSAGVCLQTDELRCAWPPRG